MSDTESGLPKVGSKAAAFKLSDGDGATVDLKNFLGNQPVVLYFYPKADTPGCTTEACGFNDALPKFTKQGVAIFGISPDPVAAVKKFSDKYKLKFPLLADPDHSVAEKYGVWQEKSMYGKKYMGVARVTFVIDKSGKIKHVFPKVKPAGHETEVLAALAAEA